MVYPRSQQRVPASAALALTACVITCFNLAGQPAASGPVKLTVPASMRSAPFNVDRYLTVPSGFDAAVYARIPGARFIAATPDNSLLVSQPGNGSVVLVRPNSSGDPMITTFAGGLRQPHDIVFHTIGATTYVYIAESHQINRFTWTPGVLTAQSREIVVTGLPDASTPELRGSYAHGLKNIALDANHKLYVSIASTCNVCVEDTTSNPVRAAIYQYEANGQNGRLYARGIRNAEGLAFVPGTTTLWVVSNGRDNTPYPHNDGTGQYGRVIPSYVDNHPAEAFHSVLDRGNYGWPFCNPNPYTASGWDDMPFDQDMNTNADGHVSCAAMNRISKGIQAHSAPLGLTFLEGTNAPAAYRSGALVALHGSWNRQTKTGYKVVWFPWTGGRPGAQADFVSGWLDGAGNVWGRPVDTAVDQSGGIFISDDASGTIYRVSASSAGSAVPNPTAWYQIVAGHSGKCLDVYGAWLGENVDLIQWPCHDGWNQQWQFTPVAQGVYKITARHSGRSIAVAGASMDPGARLQQATYAGQASQEWQLVREGSGAWKLVARHSGLSADVCGISLEDAACVSQWSDWGGANQRWSLVQK